MPENRPLTPARFWQEVYIAAIRAGHMPDDANACAQRAMTDFLKLTVEAK
jgi:hypothetical protein